MSFYGLSLFSVFYGLDWIASRAADRAADLAHRRHEKTGIMVAWITVIHQMGGAAAGVRPAGVLRISFGTYLEAFVLSGLMCIGAALMVLFIGVGRTGSDNIAAEAAPA